MENEKLGDRKLKNELGCYTAPLFSRLISACIDYLPALAILYWRPIFNQNTYELLDRTRVDWITVVLAVAIYLIYSYLSINYYEATLGQLIMGLRLENIHYKDKQLTAWQIFTKILMSPLFAFISYGIPAFALFRMDRRTLADLIAQVKVVSNTPVQLPSKTKYYWGSFLVLFFFARDFNSLSGTWHKFHINQQGVSIGFEIYKFFVNKQKNRDQFKFPPSNTIRADLEYEWKDIENEQVSDELTSDTDEKFVNRYLRLYTSFWRVKNIVQSEQDIDWIKDKYCKPLLALYPRLNRSVIEGQLHGQRHWDIDFTQSDLNHEEEVEKFCDGKISLKDYDHLELGPNVLDRICYMAREIDFVNAEKDPDSVKIFIDAQLVVFDAFNHRTMSNFDLPILKNYTAAKKPSTQYYFSILDAAAQVGDNSWQCCTASLRCPYVLQKKSNVEILTDKQLLKLASLIKLSSLNTSTDGAIKRSLDGQVACVKEYIQFVETLTYQGRLPIASSRMLKLLPKIIIEDFIEEPQTPEFSDKFFYRGDHFNVRKRGRFTNAGQKKITMTDNFGNLKEVFLTVEEIDQCVQSKAKSNSIMNSSFSNAQSKSLATNLPQTSVIKGNLENKFDNSQSNLKDPAESINIKNQLVEQIRKTFSKNGINIDINEQTGEVVVAFKDSYFDTGKADLKKEMIATLQKVIPIYSEGLFEDETAADKIASVEIIGFASPTFNGKLVDPSSLNPTDKSAVKYNLDVSYNRAKTIVSYISDTNKMKFSHQKRLSAMVKIIGRSFLAKLSSSGIGNKDDFCSSHDCKTEQRAVLKFNLKE